MSRWYKRDGAAFIQGTMGLTLEEKGAYSLCLDLIYANGAPIRDDARWLSGVCGVSMRKWNALRGRLIEAGKLFAQDGLLMNARAQQEITAMQGGDHDNHPAVSASKSARNVRETSAKPQRNDAENEVASNENNDLFATDKTRLDENRIEKKEVSPSLRSGDTAPPDSKPLPSSVPAEIVPLDPVERALEAFNRTVEIVNAKGANWARCASFTPPRRAALKKRLAEVGGIEGWCKAMARAAQSSFLLGTKGRGYGHENWRVGIDFFLQPKSFTRLREGNYDDAPGNTVNGSAALDAGFARAAAAYGD